MNLCIKLLVTSISLLSTSISQAYEIATHDKLSQKTALCSVLSQDAFIKSIGWTPIDEKNGVKFERLELIEKKGGSVKLITQQLIGWGAAYEDDISILKRPLRHFFDPLRNKPLNILGVNIPGSSTSPSWATEDGEPAVGKNQEELPGQNNSLFDANDMILAAASEPIKTKRKEIWGNFFQTLGMVIHHIQDMSQPQHVRNDAHCNGDEEGVDCYGFHNPSHYETYTNDNRVSILDKINCSSYPQLDLRFFSTARDFWLTENGNGRGIAEFTNRNFVSAGTNFRRSLFFNEIVADKKYPDPDPANNGTGPKVNKVDIQDLVLEDPSLTTLVLALSGEIWFYETLVTDNYISNYTAPNERASTASLWNDKLERYNINLIEDEFGENAEAVVRTFNLNRFNYKAAYPFLFPRTIAYGAGLINYFFRGRLEVKNVVYLAGDSLKFKVKNNTSKKNPGYAPFSFSEGSFTLYYDDNTGNRYNITSKAADQSAMILTGSKIFADKDDFDLSFNLSGIDNIDANKPFTLVFDGKIGNPVLDQTKWERGIAVKTFSPQRLLAFDVSRTDGSTPVPNIIDIYQSLDTGKSWQKVKGIPVPLNDTTPFPFDQLTVKAVAYIGDGSLLLYPDYLDSNNDSSKPSIVTIKSFRIDEYGKKTGNAIPLDWNTPISGFSNNASDLKAALRSLTYTGKNSLAVMRMKHPLPSDPTPRSRQYQLMNMPDWKTKPAPWLSSTQWGVGGLPELSWQGGNNYVTSVYVEKKESADPNTLRFDSAMRRTVDRGASYMNLANFDECVRTTTPRADEFCIQHIVAMDNNRLLGWVSQNGEDYFAKDKRGEVKLYLSLDNGANWSQYGIVPLPQGCSVGTNPYQTVDNLLYLGTKRPTAGIKEDTLFVESTCRKMILVNGQYSRFEEVGKKVSVTTDSAASWTQAVNPPHKEGRIIFAGDNGVVPDLFE